MSQENVEIVQRGYAAFLRGQPEDALPLIAEDFVATRVAPMPDPTPYHGPDGLTKILADWIQDFDEFEMNPEELIDVDDEHVVVRVHQRGVGAHSRAPIEADFWFVHKLRDGKLVRTDIYGSQAQAFGAVGLAS